MNDRPKTMADKKEHAAGHWQGYSDSVAGEPNQGKSYANPYFRRGYQQGWELDQEARRLYPNERRD